MLIIVTRWIGEEEIELERPVDVAGKTNICYSCKYHA